MSEAWLDDGDVRLFHGSALDVLRELPDRSVHMCATSPPFYGLRDYGTGEWEGGDQTCDHARPVGTTRGGPKSTLTSVGVRDGINANVLHSFPTRRSSDLKSVV